MLEHLMLEATAGLCNRLRAIASARRLCERRQAKLSLVWNWGDFWHFFAPFSGMEVIGPVSHDSDWIMRMASLPGTARVVDVTQQTVKVRSGVCFWGSDEPYVSLSQMVAFVPRLHPRLAALVEGFAAENFSRAVGFHIRRTDNRRAIANSPDSLFLVEAERVIAAGWQIFLATDNLATEQMMTSRFGASIITYPRRQQLVQRWPRPEFDPLAVDDDLLDLFLLARTSYIIGSQGSSYSGMAMALNGSPLCRKLELPASQVQSAA